jgi:hypothetical protein
MPAAARSPPVEGDEVGVRAEALHDAGLGGHAALAEAADGHRRVAHAAPEHSLEGALAYGLVEHQLLEVDLGVFGFQRVGGAV